MCLSGSPHLNVLLCYLSSAFGSVSSNPEGLYASTLGTLLNLHYVAAVVHGMNYDIEL